MWKPIVVAAAVLLAIAGPARASPIVNPDLTISDLVITYDGTSLDAVSDAGGSVLSWTLADGSFGGAIAGGQAQLTWNGTSGTFTVLDDVANPLLSGNVLSVFADGSGLAASFDVNVLLSLTSFGLGDNVQVALGSGNFGLLSANVGTGQADVTAVPVPEPATLAMLLLGGGSTAVARWRKSRRSTTPRLS